MTTTSELFETTIQSTYYLGTVTVSFAGTNLAYTDGLPTSGTLTEITVVGTNGHNFTLKNFAVTDVATLAPLNLDLSSYDSLGYFVDQFGATEVHFADDSEMYYFDYVTVDMTVYMAESPYRNYFDGGEGTDMIFGSEGDDYINDYHDGNGTGDVIMGRAGDDYIYVSSEYGDSKELYGNSGEDTLIAGDGDDVVGGGQGRDFIMAGNGDDEIRGGADKDVMYGDNAGNDNYYSFSRYGSEGGDDLMFGGSGSDKMYAGAGDDEMAGSTGHDRMEGGDGSDYIRGGKGNDFILANEMDNDFFYDEEPFLVKEVFIEEGEEPLLEEVGTFDILKGGQGNDVFAFYENEGSEEQNLVVITDYESGADMLMIISDTVTSSADQYAVFAEGAQEEDGGVVFESGSVLLVIEGASLEDFSEADFAFSMGEPDTFNEYYYYE